MGKRCNLHYLFKKVTDIFAVNSKVMCYLLLEKSNLITCLVLLVMHYPNTDYIATCQSQHLFSIFSKTEAQWTLCMYIFYKNKLDIKLYNTIAAIHIIYCMYIGQQ